MARGWASVLPGHRTSLTLMLAIDVDQGRVSCPISNDLSRLGASCPPVTHTFAGLMATTEVNISQRRVAAGDRHPSHRTAVLIVHKGFNPRKNPPVGRPAGQAHVLAQSLVSLLDQAA